MKTITRIAFLSILAFATVSAVSAQYVSYTGFCQKGAVKPQTSGQTSITNVQGSFPYCTVTVIVTGSGGTLAPIYSTATGTAKPNPFTANSDGSFQFFAQSGAVVDVQTISGGLSFTYGSQTISGNTISGYVPDTMFSSLSAACSYAYTNGLGVAVSILQVVSSNLTCNAPLSVLPGGSIQPAASVTFTIGSGFLCPPQQQCFDVRMGGSGSIVWGTPPAFDVQALWFKTGSTVDPGASVNAALASYGTNGCGSIVLSGQYSGSTGIVITNKIGCRLRMPSGPVGANVSSGSLTGLPYFNYTGNGIPLTIVNTSASTGTAGIEIDHFNLFCSGGTPTGGILIDGGQKNYVHDTYVVQCGAGITMQATHQQTDNTVIRDSVFESNTGDGIKIGRGYSTFEWGYTLIRLENVQSIQNGGYGVNAQAYVGNAIQGLQMLNNTSTSNGSGEYIFDVLVGLSVRGDTIQAASGLPPVTLAPVGVISNFEFTGGYSMDCPGVVYCFVMPLYSHLQGGFFDNTASPNLAGATFLGKIYGTNVKFRGWNQNTWDRANVFGSGCLEYILPSSTGTAGICYPFDTLFGSGQNGATFGVGTITPGYAFSAPFSSGLSVDAPGVVVTGVTSPSTTGGTFLGGTIYYVAVSYNFSEGGAESCTDQNSTNVCGVSANAVAVPSGTNANTLHVTWTLAPVQASGYNIYTGTSPTSLKLAATVSGWSATSATINNPGTGAAPPQAVLGTAAFIGPGYNSFYPKIAIAATGCTVAQPDRGYWKRVVIQLSSFTGTCTYTTGANTGWPVAFVNTPGIVASYGVSGAIVTSVSGGSFTITSSPSVTGTITLEGN